MSKELTRQWRNGELKKAFYYFKFGDTESIEIYNLYEAEKFRYVNDADKIKVLAPVPTYEEYQRLLEKEKELDLANNMVKIIECKGVVK